MTISMYQASVPTIVRQLEAMSAYLKKGEEFAREQGIDAQEILDGRLAPDMYALSRQVQIASDQAKGGIARLAGQTAPAYPDNETTFAELHQRIAKTVDYLNSFSPADIDGSETRSITLKFPDGELNFDGQTYLLHFVLPNVFFHATAAYGILRGKGAPIGKRDFIGGI